LTTKRTRLEDVAGNRSDRVNYSGGAGRSAGLPVLDRDEEDQGRDYRG